MPSILRLGAPDRHNGHLTISGDSNALESLLKDQISDFPPGKQYNIAISEVPVTVERLPYYPKEGDRLQDPGTARANIAASNESPNGTSQDNWAENHKHQTVCISGLLFADHSSLLTIHQVVQQHVVYWDKDQDGIIWPLDTYRGCRAWGWNPILCLIATFLINVNLSYPTSPSWIPDPFFRIHISNLHKDKHGSDSMTYDNEGRFSKSPSQRRHLSIHAN
jgi:peroxygenase